MRPQDDSAWKQSKPQRYRRRPEHSFSVRHYPNQTDAILLIFDTSYGSILESVNTRPDGKEPTLFIVNIDSGWNEWVDGKWRQRREIDAAK